MGVDYSAYSAIGLAILGKDLYHKTSQKGCNCNNDPESKFCANCGKPTRIEEFERIDGSPETLEPLWDRFELLVGDYQHMSHDSNSSVVISHRDFVTEAREGKVESADMPSTEDILDFKKDLKDKLEPLNLWNEGEFGLHTVCHVSY